MIPPALLVVSFHKERERHENVSFPFSLFLIYFIRIRIRGVFFVLSIEKINHGANGNTNAHANTHTKRDIPSPRTNSRTYGNA